MSEKVEIYIEGKDGLTRPAGTASKSLGGLGSVADATGKKLTALGNSLGSLGTKMTLGITLPIVGLGTVMTKMAMDAVESENLFEVSMGAMAADARKFSEELRNQFGLNSYEVRKTVGTFNVFMSSMGLAKDSSYEMAKGITKLSYDLASFYNLSNEDALQKLQSALAGEIEPMRRLGVSISETTTQQWALNKGLIKQGQEMSEAQKVMARYYVIMEQTSAAQGDLARTIDSPSNQLRIFRSRLEEIGIEVGTSFLPPLSAALKWLNDEGLPRVRTGIDNMKTSWGEMSDEAKTKVLATAGLLVFGGPLISAVAVAIRGIGLMAKAFGYLPKGVKAAVALSILALIPFKDRIADIAQAMGNIFEPTFEGSFKRTAAFLKQDWTEIGQQVAGSLGTLVDPVSDMLVAQLEDMSKKGLEELDKFTGGSRASVEKIAAVVNDSMKPPPDLKDQWDQASGGIGDAADKIAKKAKEAGVSIGSVAREMAMLHPAMRYINADVKYWGMEIDNVNLALKANQDQVKAAQAEYSAMSERLGFLNARLSEAKSRLSDLGTPRLTGMKKLDDQLFGLEQQVKRLDLQKLLLPEGADTSAIDKQIEALRKQMDILRLQGDIRYDAPLRKLKEAAEDARPEMTYAQALRAIKNTKGEIASLTGEIGAQEAAMRAQQLVIQGIQFQQDQLNATLAQYQIKLRDAETAQGLMTQALTTAFTWLTQDRQEMAKLGPEGVKQSSIVDEHTRKLLDAIMSYALGTKDSVIENLQEIVRQYETTLAEARVIASQFPAIPTVTPPEPLPFAGSFASGGIVPGQFGAPAWAIVHGGEPIGASAGAGSGGDINVYIQAPVYGVSHLEDVVVGAVERAQRRGRL